MRTPSAPLPIRPVPPKPAETPPAPMLVRLPGPLATHPEQVEASVAQIHDPPPQRGTRNLSVHSGPPKPPPPYRYRGVELPGALSELLPPALHRPLAEHFRGDDVRSATRKLFESDLAYLRGISPAFRVDLALHFDRRWGVRPKALEGVAVPYVDFGLEPVDELLRLHRHFLGVMPTPEQVKELIQDPERRAELARTLAELGSGDRVLGWERLAELGSARQAAK